MLRPYLGVLGMSSGSTLESFVVIMSVNIKILSKAFISCLVILKSLSEGYSILYEGIKSKVLSSPRSIRVVFKGIRDHM